VAGIGERWHDGLLALRDHGDESRNAVRAVIEVRIKPLDLVGAANVESKLIVAGVPPAVDRNGALLQWWDARTDEFVYEYYEPDEMQVMPTKSIYGNAPTVPDEPR
jgi:hypothetical protein